MRADQAGRAFAVQGGPKVAREVLDGLTALEPVSDTRGDIVVPDLQVPALIRTVRDAGLPLGALIEGRRPQDASELTVTRATAESLKVGLGGTVRTTTDSATSRALRVVGITVDPSERDALGAVVVDPDLDPASATVWLSDTDPYSLSELQPVLDQRLATYQSVESLVADSEARLPGELQDLRYAGWGLAALLLLFLATSVVTFAPVARADAEALEAAGVPASDAWGLLTRLVVIVVVVGQLLGGVLALAALRVSRAELSAQVGQYWLGVQAPWPWVIGLPLLVVLLGAISPRLVAVTFVATRLVRGRNRVTTKTSTAAWIALGAGVALLVVAGIAKGQDPPGQLTRLAPVGAVLVAFGLPGVLLPLTLVRMPPASRLISARLAGGLRRALVVVALIVTMASVHAAQVSQDTMAFEEISQTPQPPGSLLINEMPDTAAVALLEEYRERGGEDASGFSVPVESKNQLRVTGPGLVKCMQQADTRDLNSVSDSCFPQTTSSPVNTVALSTTGATDNLADPGLVEQQAVGLLQFQAGSGEVLMLGEAPASPDTRLGGNLPGLVVAPDSDLAQRFDLRPTGTSVVALFDFDRLTARDRAAIRASAARLAPSSLTVDATGDTAYQKQRALAGGQALGAAALILLLLLAAAAAVTTANRRTLRVLIDIGSSPRARRNFALRWAFFPVACAVVLFPVIIATAAISSIGTVNNIGYLWAAPPITFLVASVLIIFPFLRVPPRTGE